MAKKLRGVTDVKTAIRSKVFSKPRLKGSEYLEMFILEKNKIRLEQEKENLEKRKGEIEKDIRVIAREIARLENTVSHLKHNTWNPQDHRKPLPQKQVKTMTMDY
jgi:hypothetical protein